MLGKTLSGRYKIVKYLGGGGFGQTYFAEDLQLPGNPLCVVKQLKPKATDAFTLQTAGRLFDREAQVLYTLGNHDQIPRLLAHFEEEQEFYLVQEFIDGNDLKEELPFGKRLSETQVIALVQDILKILEFVHQQNVIHRDIKPSNLIRRKQDSKIVLIDFGAVKQVSTQTANSEGHTTLTVAIGSPGYMPNEQLAGQPQFCSDIYAVGMIGIQALTGWPPQQVPKDPRTSEILLRDKLLGNTLHEQVQTSPELAELLEKMVRYDYRQRYQTAAEALQALEQLPNSKLSPSIAPAFEDTLPMAVSPSQSTITWPPPPPASSPVPMLDNPVAPTVLPVEPTQALPSQQTAPVSPSKEPEVKEQTITPSISSPRNQSPRLIKIGAGIATALALTVGIYHFHEVSRSTTESQWAQKISLSQTLSGNSNSVNPVAISQDGKTLASGGEEGAIQLWDLGTGKLRSTLKGHSAIAYSLAMSRDSQILASGSADETIKIWNLNTGQQIRTLSRRLKGISSLAISPDGQTLVSGDRVGTMAIWNLNTGELINVFEGHKILVTSLAISPNGQTLVSSSQDNTIKLWDLKSGALIRTLTASDSRHFFAVAISPNGQTIASGAGDGGIRLWDLGTGKLLQTLTGGSDPIYSVTFRPAKGETLISGGKNGAIRLWDLRTEKLMRTLTGHSGAVQSLALSQDGQTLVASSSDKTIRIWRSP
ncbi:MAG TPA: serine/threonine-protein kinase [Coleofasciculaceae cyanobacterium]|jgi:serine/threonine protein kinase